MICFLADFNQNINVKLTKVLRNGKFFVRNAHRRKLQKGLKNISGRQDQKIINSLSHLGLTPLEIQSLTNYVKNGDHYLINNMKKGLKVNDAIYAQRSLIDRALRKLPKLDDTEKSLWRYISIDPKRKQHFLNLHDSSTKIYNTGKTTFNNGVITTNTPYSTGKYRTDLEAFTNTDGVLFEYQIHPKKTSRGKYLEPFFQTYEHEVMFPSKSKFKILNIKDDNDLVRIKLLEL